MKLIRERKKIQGTRFEFTPTKRRWNDSVSNIRAGVKTQSHQLHDLPYFFPTLPSLTFYETPSPRATRGSAIYVFLVAGRFMNVFKPVLSEIVSPLVSHKMHEISIPVL